ncbi:MAG: TRAP transporter TatT component family protein [Candidatus Bipolaricaulis sp.]|nr:TRAP transporter TatT component family protein [Candidatus Bipolaricaulis sp.]MDD5646124.1 TRAP transporter TatT component family protein [Candidatus Bipolaricaulis sp.]
MIGLATAGFVPTQWECEGEEETETASKLTPIAVLVLTALATTAQAAPMDLEDALAIFQGDRVVVEYNSQGRAQLEAAIEAIKNALSVPADLDEESEREVNAFFVAMEERELVVKLSQGYFTLGVIFADGRDEEETAYRKGKHWGLKSLRVNPGFSAVEEREGFLAAVSQETNAPALYWPGLNWLSLANFDRLTAVSSGVVKKTIAMLERVLELDEAYDAHGAYRVLGSIWGALPWAPLGTYRRDLEQTRTYLCHVVDDPRVCGNLAQGYVDPICSEYLGNRRVFAEFYLTEKGLWADAAAVLQSIIDAPIGQTYRLFNPNAQDDARRLLEEVAKHL